jgi:hypothetical protein
VWRCTFVKQILRRLREHEGSLCEVEDSVDHFLLDSVSEEVEKAHPLMAACTEFFGERGSVVVVSP